MVTNIKSMVKEFGKSETDTGSVPVQIALLTEKINSLREHFKKFPQDFSSKRGLLKMVAQRRKSLAYLERTNKEEYKSVINRLNLRK